MNNARFLALVLVSTAFCCVGTDVGNPGGGGNDQGFDTSSDATGADIAPDLEPVDVAADVSWPDIAGEPLEDAGAGDMTCDAMDDADVCDLDVNDLDLDLGDVDEVLDGELDGELDEQETGDVDQDSVGEEEIAED